MTKRRIRTLAFDDEHLRLMTAYRNARGGERTSALKALQAYVRQCLEAA